MFHPNLFRESYAITLQSTDYHALSLPDALKGYAAVSGAVLSDIQLEELNPERSREIALLTGKDFISTYTDGDFAMVKD